MDEQELREIVNTALDRSGLAHTDENIAAVSRLVVERIEAKIEEMLK